jgi:hypothetical protein
MFELNNLGLVVPSPVEDYFIHIDDLPDDEKEEAEKVTRPFLDALGEDYAAPCEGMWSFFPSLSPPTVMSFSIYPAVFVHSLVNFLVGRDGILSFAKLYESFMLSKC